MKISCSEVGSITLIETALLGLFGLVFLVGFYAFQTSADGIVAHDRCVTDSDSLADSSLVDPALLEDEDPCANGGRLGEIDHAPPAPGDTDGVPAGPLD